MQSEEKEITKEYLLSVCFVEQDNGSYTLSIFDYGYNIKYLEWRGDWSIGIVYYDPLDASYLEQTFNFNGVGLKYQKQLEDLIYCLQFVKLDKDFKENIWKKLID